MDFTDLAASDLATDDLAAPATGGVRTLDAQLRRMRFIERSWSLPGLPDSVKLDLLANRELLDENAVADFMWGLQADVDQATRPRPEVELQNPYVPPAPDTSWMTQPQVGEERAAALAMDFGQRAPSESALFLPQDDFANELRRVFHGIAGLRAPDVVTHSAVVDLKRRAIKAGLLPEDTPLDQSWSPAMNGIRQELMIEDLRSRMIGDKPGAVQTNRIVELIDEWASPSGLLSAAVALDFLPDPKAIGKELSGWGDKWRSFLDKPSFGGLVDALTGPLDDIALPVLNTALLFSGVGSTVAFANGVARLSQAGRLARTTGALARGLDLGADAARIAGSVGIADEVARFARPGFIASRLSRSSTPLWRSTGNAMTAWRQWGATMATKKAVQQGMKIGFIGQVESTLLPGTSGIGLTGAGLQSDRIDEFQAWRTDNPLVSTVAAVAELPLTPTTIFKPGTFTDPLKKLARATTQALTSVPDDARLMGTMYSATREFLAATDPAAAARLQEAARRTSPGQALVEHFADGDAEKFGAMALHIVVSAAIDKQARQYADLLTDSTEGTWHGVYHLFRNKFIDQLRPAVMPAAGDVDSIEAFARQAASAHLDTPGDWLAFEREARKLEARGRKTRARQFRAKRRILSAAVAEGLMKGDPGMWENARLLTDSHNKMRAGHLHTLLHDLTDEDLAAYMVQGDVWNRLDKWDDFNAALADVHSELLNGQLTLQPVNARALRDGGWEWRPSSLADVVERQALDPDVWRGSGRAKRRSWTSQFNEPVDPLRERVTVMRMEHFTRQQAGALREYGSHLLRLRKLLSKTEDGLLPVVAEQVAEAGVDLTRMKASQVEQMIASMIESGAITGATKGRATRVAMALRWAQKQGADPNDIVAFVDRKIRELDSSDIWTKANLKVSALDSEGNIRSLEQKLQALARTMPFIAAEVKVPPALAKRLAEQGYKAVVGTNFMMPDDLMDIGRGMFGELTQRHLRRQTLGTFLDRHSNEALSQLRERRFRSILARELGDVDPRFDWSPDSPDVDRLLEDIRQARRDMLQAAEQAADSQASVISRAFERAKATGLPFSIFEMREKDLIARLGDVYGEDMLRKVAGALRKARQVGFEYTGLAGIEDYLVANSWVREALGVFSKTRSAEALMTPGKKSAFVGALSALATYQMTGELDQAALGGALGAGVARLDRGRLFNARFPARLAAAQLAFPVVGGAVTAATDDSSLGFQAGLVGGLAAATGLGPAARLVARQLDDVTRSAAMRRIVGSRDWGNYSRLGDGLVHLRNRLRFGLSPWFDLQRYTETAVLAGTARLPEGFQLPVRTSLKSYARKNPERAKTLLQEFDRASASWFRADEVEATQRYFRERGIMGFSPAERMAVMWGHLTDQGMDAAEAVETVRNIMTYGIEGRSAAELSVNFVFFPFSFQKKYLGQVARFMADDLGRTVLIHDALKAYEILNERYDLSDKLRDHMPLLQQLRRVNALAYGISPGELGGINRPIIDAFMATPLDELTIDPVLNLFLPQAIQVGGDDGWDGAALRKFADRLVPVYRDIDNLLADVAAQGHVVFSDSHMTKQAEARAGWEEWQGVKAQVEELARAQGVTYQTLMQGERYAPIANLVRRKRYEIARKYPAWEEAQAQAAAMAIERDAEVRRLVDAPTNEAEAALAQYVELVDQAKEVLRSRGVSMSDPEMVPPEIFDAFRRLAIFYARRTPGFDGLYRRYFMSEFGPIHTEVI